MLGRARVSAVWGNAPSAEDIRKVDQERLLQNPLLVEAGAQNFKVTYPEDFAMAEAVLRNRR